MVPRGPGGGPRLPGARPLPVPHRPGDHGELPPNNWQSVFGGPAWTRVDDTDQWYLHLFDTSQPDLDWRNPEVDAMFQDVLRFWLDRGADGFRIDVAHGLLKEESLRDQVHEAPSIAAAAQHDPTTTASRSPPTSSTSRCGTSPGCTTSTASWHPILEEYAAMAVAEAWTRSPETTAAYVRPDELQQTFNFAWLLADWDAAAFRDVIASTIEATRAVGAWPTWVLNNHDVIRSVTRYGGGAAGLARARAATLATLALPGAAYLYQGEELGLPEVDVAPEHRQDPSWFRTGKPGRDGCRVPMPWAGSAPPYAFGPGPGAPWIPQPADWGALTVERQQGDSGLDARALSPRPHAAPGVRHRRRRRRGRAPRPGAARAGLPTRGPDRGRQLRRERGPAARRRAAARKRTARRAPAAARHRRVATRLTSLAADRAAHKRHGRSRG